MRPLSVLFFLITLGAILVLGLVMSRAFAQDEMVPVNKKQLELLVAEHLATRMALDAAEREIDRLKAKLACV